MTAGFGLPAALLLGLVLGFGRIPRWTLALVWFVALAMQTAYLARPGVTGFDGGTGLHTVRWWVYWATQPLILAAALGVLWLGARLRGIVLRRRVSSASAQVG